MKFCSTLLLGFLLVNAAIATEQGENIATLETARSYHPPPRVGVGEPCNIDELCRTGLVCESHICKIEVGKGCAKSPKSCQRGAVCVGSKAEKRCVRPRGVGKACGTTFVVCANGLECRDKRCAKPKIKVGGDCLPAGSVCNDGLTCAGTDTKKRCVRIRQPGQDCKEDDPFSVCKTGLNCAGARCRTPEGASCLPRGSVCVSGTVCRGTETKKRCVTPVGLGAGCGTSPFIACERPLVCEDKKCQRPRIKEAGMCTAPGARCEKGLVCVGRPKYKLCARPLGAGKVCGVNEFVVCKRPLVCENKRCKTALYGNCTARGSVCVKGAVCVGDVEDKECVEPSPLGGKCHGRLPCDGNLLCFRNQCVRPRRSIGKRCSHVVRCVDGLDCKYLAYFERAICVRVSGLGKTCGMYVVCPSGQRCMHGKCQAVYKH